METKFFYKVTLPILILLLICTCSCTTAAKPDTNFELRHQYYQLTEILLQEIDDDTNWSTTIADEVEETKAYYTVRNLITTTDCVTISHYRLYYKVTQNLIKYLDNRYDLGDTTFEGDTYCKWCNITKKIQQ